MPKRGKARPVAPSSQGQPLPREAGLENNRGTRVVAAASYEGPIPPPAMLREYDLIIPNGADRILKMAESQLAHRQALESKVVSGDALRSWVGLIAGVTVALAILAVSGVLIWNGHDWAGTALGTVDIAAIVGVFVYGTESRKNERIQKSAGIQPMQGSNRRNRR